MVQVHVEAEKLIHFYYYIHRQATKEMQKEDAARGRGKGRKRAMEEGENAHVAKSPLAVAHVKSSLKIKVGQKLQIIFVLLGLRCGVCAYTHMHGYSQCNFLFYAVSNLFA